MTIDQDWIDRGDDGWSGQFGAALNFASGLVPQAPNTVETVPSNAVQSMQPVSNAQTSSWSGFWQDMARGALGYAIQKDAIKSGLSATPAPSGVALAPAVRQNSAAPLLLLAGVGLVAYLAARG